MCLLRCGLLGVPRALNPHLAHTATRPRPQQHDKAMEWEEEGEEDIEEASTAMRRAGKKNIFSCNWGLDDGLADCVEYSVTGQFSGELSFLTEETRKCTLVALEGGSEIWHLSRTNFEELMNEHPRAAVLLHRIALRYASHRLNHLLLFGQVHSV
mmetsp:Transcript_32563/g.44053  ORF Transcript_32563/g.44053 Transcript_32563/m.44053 type:complete len:155 (-) Transcript_32563:240-704(-)